MFEKKGRRGVKAATDIPKNMFVAEYEAEVLTPEEALEREERYKVEGEDLYVLQASYNQKKYIFDATYKFSSIGRLINHSKKRANIILRQPVEIDGKLRIGFLAKRDIKRGEELRYDYDLLSYSRPEWYLEPDSDSEKQCESDDESDDEQPESSPSITKLKRCLVPGCEVTVIKIWNHVHRVHKNLPGEGTIYLQIVYTVICLTALSLASERADYVKKSKATVVYSDQQKGRRVTSSSRGKPFHNLDNEKFTGLKR